MAFLNNNGKNMYGERMKENNLKDRSFIHEQKSIVSSNKIIADFKGTNEDFNFYNKFYGIEATLEDKKHFKDFIETMRLKSQGLSPNEISKQVGIHKSTIEKWIFNKNLPFLGRMFQYYMSLENPGNMKWISLNSTRGGLFKGPWIQVPEKIYNYDDILFVLRQLSPLESTSQFLKAFNIDYKDLGNMKPLFFAYLLGVMIGDASKDGVQRKQRTNRRIGLSLSKKYKTNERLGNFVSMCANSIGMRMERIKDTLPGKMNVHPFYRWSSQSSALIEWIFRDCMNLDNNKLTTYDAVNMEWVLTAPKEFRIWFIQGIADSDGFVDLSSVQAGLITHPNTEFIEKIFNSLDIKTSRKLFTKNGLWSLIININDSFSMPLFNPFVKSYRYSTLEKFAKLKRFKWHYPDWINKKISYYINQGFSGTELVKIMAEKENVLIRTKRVSNRIKLKKLIEK